MLADFVGDGSEFLAHIADDCIHVNINEDHIYVAIHFTAITNYTNDGHNSRPTCTISGTDAHVSLLLALSPSDKGLVQSAVASAKEFVHSMASKEGEIPFFQLFGISRNNARQPR